MYRRYVIMTVICLTLFSLAEARAQTRVSRFQTPEAQNAFRCANRLLSNLFPLPGHDWPTQANRILDRDPGLAEFVRGNRIPVGGGQTVDATDFFSEASGAYSFRGRAGKPAHVQLTDVGGVRALSFNNTDAAPGAEWNLFLSWLRMGGPRHLPGYQPGAAFTTTRPGAGSKTFWVFDTSKTATGPVLQKAPASVVALPDDARRMVTRVYEKKITGEGSIYGYTRQHLVEHHRISEETADRSLTMVKTRQAPSEAAQIEHFDVEASMTAILARTPEEKLPLEIRNANKPDLLNAVSRFKRDGPTVELGRVARADGVEVGVTPTLLAEAMSAVLGFRDDVQWVMIEASPTIVAKIFDANGYPYSLIHKMSINGGKEEWIIAIQPRLFFERTAQIKRARFYLRQQTSFWNERDGVVRLPDALPPVRLTDYPVPFTKPPER